MGRGRKALPENQKKSNRQIAKDYRTRHAERVNHYEHIRQERRKLERLLKKIPEEERGTEFAQSLLSEYSKLTTNTQNTSQDELTQNDEDSNNFNYAKEETVIKDHTFTKSDNVLVDILESMDVTLDIKVVCCDGSFMWSRLFLSFLSPLMKQIFQQDDKSDVFIVDCEITSEVIQDALRNLLKVESEWREEYRDVYELFHIPRSAYEFEQKGDVLKVEELDEGSENNYSIYDIKSLHIEESNSAVELSSIHCNDNDSKIVEKPENSFNIISERERIPNSTSKLRECQNTKVKQEKIPKLKDAEKVWIKDPSPKRVLDGKKVKWICVTQKNVSTGPPYYCIGCSYKYDILDNVNRHYRIHADEKLFTCKLCAKKFKSSTAVTSHWNNRHNKEREKKFSCDICGLLFLSSSILVRHQIVHSGEAFTCGICSKEFNSPWKRDCHEKIHSQKSTPCPYMWKRVF